MSGQRSEEEKRSQVKITFKRIKKRWKMSGVTARGETIHFYKREHEVGRREDGEKIGESRSHGDKIVL